MRGPLHVAAVIAALVGCAPSALVSVDDPTGVPDASMTPPDAGSRSDAGEVSDASADAGPAQCVSGDAGVADYSPRYAFVRSDAGAQDKAFYLLTLFDADQRIQEAFRRNQTLAALGADHEAAFRAATMACGDDVGCYRSALTLNPDEVARVAAALPLALGPCELSRLVQTHLRPSGLFALHAGSTDSALLTQAWADAATALAGGFEKYVASLDGATVRALVSRLRTDLDRPLAFYEPQLRVVIAGLAQQGRDEAVRYDPLETGQNAAALAHLSSIVWSDYSFTVMLVPGQGPENSDPLSPIGRARCDLAATAFAKKRAALLLLSGGHVHPDRTSYAEAVEMKKYLMTAKGVPESAILIDPYARHTTTNLRNLARAIFRLGIPADRKAVVMSDPVQSLIITYQTPKDCRESLGYEPFTAMTRLNANEVSLLPAQVALQADGRDLLDP